jgi:hypothetical protein
LRFDINASLLPVLPTDPSSPDLESPRPAVTARDEALERPRRSQILLFGLGTSIASDRSLWANAEGAILLSAGAVLLGPTIRISRDLQTSGQSKTLSSSRTSSDLLLTAGWRIERSTWALMPVIAVGLNWLHVSGGKNDGSALNEEAPESDLGGMRASIGLVLALPLPRQRALAFFVSEELSPLAHTRPFAGGGKMVAGEPRAYFQSGIGMSFGS